ncbi:MAG: superoxide dismutase family protein [Polyangiales bacterium]
MRVLSIAVCLSVAASLAACEEEPTTWFPPDAGRDAGPAADGGARDGGNPAALGGLDAGAPAAKLPVENDGEWVIFEQDGGAENPAAEISGDVSAKAIDGGTEFTLAVEGLPGTRPFGTHLHTLPCAEQQGGPHYQHLAPPAGTPLTDPKFANETNEVWLDFEADAEGKGARTARVGFVPRKGGANSVVVHERLTGDGGVAGARLACTNIPFAD